MAKGIRSAACVLALAAVFCAAGCDILSGRTSTPAAPGLAALADVIEEVYLTQGDGRVLFLGTEVGAVDDSTLAEAMADLQQRLQTEVCHESQANLVHPDHPLFTPVLPDTGQAGVIIRIIHLGPEAAGIWRMRMLIARSCGDRLQIEHQLGWDGADWMVIDTQTELDEMGCY
jgi:hypothetical protein